MKLHRFFVGDTNLEHDFWLKNERMYHQWARVLRFQVDREVVLFNDQHVEKLFRIVQFGDDKLSIHVELITEMQPKVPENDIYLCFSLLKKDKNDWVLQKATELGIRHFIPLITDRTEKTGFDVERSEKIVVEAAEQCGRADIPRVREPLSAETVIKELTGKVELYVAEEGGEKIEGGERLNSDSIAVFVGPEGGWSDQEKAMFKEKNVVHAGLSEFTLRAETAAIAAAVQFCS